MIYVQHLHKQVHSMHFHYKSRFITKVRSHLLSYFMTLKIIGVFHENKPERVFGLQVRCRELDIYKIRFFLRNCLQIFWIYSGFLGEIFLEDFSGKIFLGGFFREDFFGRIFLEGFFQMIFLGGLFGGFFGRNSL